jgi:hypothetical protein
VAETGWQRKFEDPIPLPNGRQLVTLQDAADYIMKLPKTESDLPDWQVAIEALMLCSRGGGTLCWRSAGYVFGRCKPGVLRNMGDPRGINIDL